MKKVLFTLVAIATFGAANAQNVNLTRRSFYGIRANSFNSKSLYGGVNAAVADSLWELLYRSIWWSK